MSLVIGSIFGSLLIISSLLIHYKKAIGSYLALILTTILTATFAYRYTITGKTFPAVLAVFSAAMLLFLLARYAKWKKE